MNQSTVIFGFLAAAFLVFITQRGELPVYWGLLVKSPSTPASGPGTTANGSISASDIAHAASTIADLAAVAG